MMAASHSSTVVLILTSAFLSHGYRSCINASNMGPSMSAAASTDNSPRDDPQDDPRDDPVPSMSAAVSTDTSPRADPREVCGDVELQAKDSRVGQFSFMNANETANIDIEDKGEHAWNIQTPTAGNQTITLPSVHINSVNVECVRKGLCKDMVTKAINHWRFEAWIMGNFGVSLSFIANPAIAGCICFMDAMMQGHSRNKLFVRTKSEVEVSTHEGVVANGEDIELDEILKGVSFTINQATQACLTMIPGCQGFSMKQGPPEDPATKFPIEEFHFKDKMSVQDLATEESWTSYHVRESSPYTLQYEPRDGHHWYREWCKQTFQDLMSPLQNRPWLFL